MGALLADDAIGKEERDVLGWIVVFVLVVLLVLTLLRTMIKVVTEYERGVIFRLGRVQGAKGPGLFFIIPIVDQMVKVDLRVRDAGRTNAGGDHT